MLRIRRTDMKSPADAETLFRVDGLVAVITGGETEGVGLTMARALAFHGARRVYLLGQRLEILQSAAWEHPSMVPVQCDVTSKSDLQAAVDRVSGEVGYVNLVVANAGTSGPPGHFAPDLSLADLRRTLFADFSMEGMTDTMNLNVTAAFFTMTAFLELLDAGNRQGLQGGYGQPNPNIAPIPPQSQVIFTTCVSAFSRNWSSSPSYLTSKAAVMQVTKYASAQLARYGIRVNAIAPGLTPSDRSPASPSSPISPVERHPEQEAFDFHRSFPARRHAGAEDMTGAILYLASRAGSYSNGTILVTDSAQLSAMGGAY
ncbi:NAD(P)-binding protein [Penicillium capsulatum]|uniref:NAD(P)-binding protein n=1 Tax=Penicillium capsulatum TaxID=69766 RepID=A0A9W9HYV6_9EURO|nr:NAD(P)-binding protein [Penicillium capsulatum]KAJ6116774.1 NAD(P)-binding protein [Penicillium capsulatum]